MKEIIEIPGVGSREVVVPGSYERLDDSSRQGLFAVLLAPFRGIVQAADIVSFVLIVGGVFGVLQKTGAVEAALHSVLAASNRSRKAKRLIIPIFMVLFSLGGAIFGMAEETIPFVLIFVPMARSLGYDAMVGVAIPIVGAQAGFAAAFLNPFTIGVAQGIAAVPLFSGIGLRLVVWVVTTSLAVAFVMFYATRVKHERAEASGPPRHISNDSDRVMVVDEVTPLSTRHTRVLVTFAAGIVLLVVGVIRWGWYIEEIAGLFLGLGVVLGVSARLRPREVSGAFMDGTRTLVATAVIIGMARGILVVLEDGRIVDTVLNGVASAIEGIGPTGSALVMFAAQTVLNLFVPSGSGQAALTMPIMAPLADLVGVSRQVAVLAFQFGDGFTNMIIPTNAVLIGALSLGGVPWTRWAKWILPLQLLLFVLGLITPE